MRRKGPKSTAFEQTRHFEKAEAELAALKEITFSFPYELKPGSYFLDVKIIEKGGLVKTRKIFEVKG